MKRGFTRARVALAMFVCGGAIAMACSGSDSEPGEGGVDSGEDGPSQLDSSSDDSSTDVTTPLDTSVETMEMPDVPETSDVLVDSGGAADAPTDSVAKPDSASDSAVADASDAADSGPPLGCFRYTQGASGYTSSVPAIAPGGALPQVWAASWTGYSPNLYARFGGADGGYSSFALEPIVGSARSADVVKNGGSFGAVYASGLADAGNGVFFRSFDGGVGPDSGGAAVFVSAGVAPKIARGASEYGLTWVDATSSYVFARLSDSGVLLDTPKAIGGTPILVAHTGAEYGVVYVTSAGVGIPAPVKLARFSAATGLRVVATDVTIAMYTSRASAAGTGDGYVLAWFEPGADGGLGSYMLARFDATGALKWKKPGFGEAVAWSGTEIALLYFTTTGSGLSTSGKAHLDRYTGAGDPIPPQQVQSLGLCNPQGSTLEWTGTSYSYSYTSSGTGLSPSATVAIDCFSGSGLPIP